MDEVETKEAVALPTKVQVLLAEYSSLRSHIVARTSAAIQAITISIASLALIASQLGKHPFVGGILLGILAVVVTLVALFIYRDLLAETAHVRRLEARINHMAGEVLLTYETEHGISKGMWSRLRATRQISN